MELFCPALVLLAMIARFGTTTKLTDDDGFVVRNLPLHLGGIVHITIPSDVLVEAHYIHVFVHVVVQTIHVVGSACHLHRHRDEAGAVLCACICSESAEERVTLRGVGRLVGDAPDDDVGTVLVTCNHVTQLCLCIVESLGVCPCNCPINRNFRPYEDAHALSLLDGVFVVRIVCQTYEVAA